MNWRRLIHKPFTSIARIVLKHKVRLIRIDYIPNGKPTIYAINHVFKEDVPSVVCCLQNNVFAVVSNTVRKSFDGLVLWLNGVIWVDRSDKTSRVTAKEKMISTLQKGDDVLIAPEATHNFSPNLLLYKLWGGLLDVARVTNVDIVPVAVDLVNDDYCVIIGETFDYAQYTDKTEAIDVMATMVWELYEMKPKANRVDVSEEEFLSYVNSEMARMPYENFELCKDFIRA